jgi:hypothetical protein
MKHEAYDDGADLGKRRNRQVAPTHSSLRNHLAKVRVAGSSPVARSRRCCRSGPFSGGSLIAFVGMYDASGREQAAEIHGNVVMGCLDLKANPISWRNLVRLAWLRQRLHGNHRPLCGVRPEKTARTLRTTSAKLSAESSRRRHPESIWTIWSHRRPRRCQKRDSSGEPLSPHITVVYL